MMVDIYEKVNSRMTQLEHFMESNYHLEDPDKVEAIIDSISKFWSVLSEEDKDYIQAARYAIEDKLKWGK